MRKLISFFSLLLVHMAYAKLDVHEVEIPASAFQAPSISIDADTLGVSEISELTAQTKPGSATVSRLSETKALLKSIYSANFSRFAAFQQQIPLGIIVKDGQVTLDYLAKRHPQWIKQKSDQTYLAVLPIIIDIGGQLLVHKGETLLLGQETGSFLHNNGTLIVSDGSILGWNSQRASAALVDSAGQSFRPFILSYGGSRTLLHKANIASLGYNDSSSYGLTLRTATQATLEKLTESERLLVVEPPSIRLLHSILTDMYTGVYLDGVANSIVAENQITNTITDGIQINNVVNRLHIHNNIIEKTAQKHGIIISKQSSNVLITHNTVQGAAGSGIVNINSDDNILAFNTIESNSRDGVSVYESTNTRLYGNRIYLNQGNGIRVRSSPKTRLHQNVILANSGTAVYLHTRDDTDNPLQFAASNDDIEVIGGLIMENKSGVVFSERSFNLRLGNLRFENNGSKPFRGDLEALSQLIRVTASDSAKAAEIVQAETSL